MEMKIMTAIFALAILVVGGIGVGVALPGDVEYMKTPEERAVEFTADVADQKQDLYRAYEAGQISKYALVTYTDALAYKLEARIEKYERMYDLLVGQIWSTDDGPKYGTFVVPNVEFTVGNSTYSLGPGTFSYYGDGITVVVGYYTVTATVLAFDEDAGTATLIDVVINGYSVPGTYEVNW